MSSGFFRDNTVNRLEVIGGKQFELTANAMDGNSAQFPQIIISGCNTVVLCERAFNREFKLNVTDVKCAQVFQNAFTNTNFIAQFLRVNDLRIEEGALVGANNNSRLIVMDSKMDDLWPLQAVMKEILFEKTEIRRIRENAFNSQEVKSVEFVNCTIDVIQGKAFTEKVNLAFVLHSIILN